MSFSAGRPPGRFEGNASTRHPSATLISLRQSTSTCIVTKVLLWKLIVRHSLIQQGFKTPCRLNAGTHADEDIVDVLQHRTEIPINQRVTKKRILSNHLMQPPLVIPFGFSSLIPSSPVASSITEEKRKAPINTEQRHVLIRNYLVDESPNFLFISNSRG